VRQFTLNEFRAPKAVMDAISLKNVMSQQALTAQNELQKNSRLRLFEIAAALADKYVPEADRPR
jgi:hypothetical protein